MYTKEYPPFVQQPSSEHAVLDMMTKEDPTERYWEELAEERRVALEETLKENEEVSTVELYRLSPPPPPPPTPKKKKK